MLYKFNNCIFTLFNIGKLPASGTFGSLFTVIVYLFVYNFFSNLLFLFMLCFIFIYSLFFLKTILKNFKNDDPKEIVIDEYIGQSIPLLICDGNLILILISFFSFRFFDIFKIFPANYFDKNIKGIIGIIGDDIIAGLYCFILIYFLNIYI